MESTFRFLLTHRFRFRLVEFQLKYVLRQGGPVGINAALSEKSLPKSLPEAYRKVMDQMEEGQKKFAFHIMSWIFHAGRLLTICELCEALSINDDSEDLREELIPQPDSIVESCESLVEVDKDSQEVRFTHQTVNEFLREHCTMQMLSSADLAKSCLIYLGFPEFDEPCLEIQFLEQRFEKYKFSNYAARFWSLHTKGAGETRVEVRERLYTAFISAEREHSLDQLYGADKIFYLSKAINSSFLHIVASEGLATICRMLLHDNSEEIGRYVIIYVSRLIRLPQFINSGDIEAKDRFSATPLHYAVTGGHLEVAQLLTEKNADVISIQNEYGETPLHYAVRKGFESIVKLLVDKNADAISIQNKDGETPLHIATIWKDDILRMLLEKNKDTFFLKDLYGETVLHRAARYGKEGMIKALVEKCPDLVSIKNLRGETALQVNTWDVADRS
jgi:hypothetical protein